MGFSSSFSSLALPQRHIETPLKKDGKVITRFRAHGGVEVRDSPASGSSRKRCFHFWVNANVARNNCFRWPPAGRPEWTGTACRYRKNKLDFFSKAVFLLLWRESFTLIVVWVCECKTLRKRCEEDKGREGEGGRKEERERGERRVGEEGGEGCEQRGWER